MTSFSVSPPLAQSSYNHGVYLANHKIMSHYQTNKKSQFFTGESPTDRAYYSGWQFARVLENFTFGQTNSFKSIDGLFTSIYHRIAFLDFYADTVGAALVGEAYVFNMSNSKANNICSQKGAEKGEGRIFGVCRAKDKLILKDAYEATQEGLAKQNPEIVIWPPANAKDVVPVFYEEIPDPLPKHSVSGNPISIHFNPYYYPDDTEIKLQKFTLLEDCKKPVKKLIYLTKETDPNKMLSFRDFVIFPDERMSFNTKYCVKADFEVNKEKPTKEWSFATVKPHFNLVTVPKKKKSMNFFTEKKQPLYIYFEPSSPKDKGGSVSFTHPQEVIIKTSFYDSNTLIVELDSFLPSGEVNIFFGNKNITLNF